MTDTAAGLIQTSVHRCGCQLCSRDGVVRKLGTINTASDFCIGYSTIGQFVSSDR